MAVAVCRWRIGWGRVEQGVEAVERGGGGALEQHRDEHPARRVQGHHRPHLGVVAWPNDLVFRGGLRRVPQAPRASPAAETVLLRCRPCGRPALSARGHTKGVYP